MVVVGKGVEDGVGIVVEVVVGEERGEQVGQWQEGEDEGVGFVGGVGKRRDRLV